MLCSDFIFLHQEPIFPRRINFSLHILSALHWLSRLNVFQKKLKKATTTTTTKNTDRKNWGSRRGSRKGSRKGSRRGSRRGPNWGPDWGVHVLYRPLLNQRSEEKTFSLTFIPGKNKSKCGLSWSYRHWVRFITLFPTIFLIASACRASLQKFLKGKSDAYKVARCRCFRQQILTNISFVVFNIVVKTNPMWLSLVCILINNDTGHHSSQNLLWNHWFFHACRHKQNFHENLNGFFS